MKTDIRDLTVVPSLYPLYPLYPLYARVLRGAPFCYDISEDEFVEGATYRGPWTRAPLAHERVVTATESGDVVGFAQVGAAPSQQPGDDDRGVIRFTPMRRAGAM